MGGPFALREEGEGFLHGAGEALFLVVAGVDDGDVAGRLADEKRHFFRGTLHLSAAFEDPDLLGTEVAADPVVDEDGLEDPVDQICGGQEARDAQQPTEHFIIKNEYL